MGQRLRHLARAAMRHVRKVLKRGQGGVRHRHVDEASDCAPAITAFCHTEKAAIKRGLPGGKPVSYSNSPFARDVSALRHKLSFQSEITSPRAIDARHTEIGCDLICVAIGKRWNGQAQT